MTGALKALIKIEGRDGDLISTSLDPNAILRSYTEFVDIPWKGLV